MCNCGGNKSKAAAAVLRQAVPPPLPENMTVVTWAVQPPGMTRYLGPVSGAFYNVYRKGARVTVYLSDVEYLKSKGLIESDV